MGFRDREIAEYDRRVRKEEEAEDIQIFIDTYPRATGKELILEEVNDRPDAVCRRADGTVVGIEHTRVRRWPEQARFEASYYRRDEMDPGDTFDEINRLIEQKAAIRPNFLTSKTILMIAIYESDFDLAARIASDISEEDLISSGFEEIWLVDFKGIREGAHREVRLFGLYPAKWRTITDRSAFDRKPYG
jgi:hypothetical protein